MITSAAYINSFDFDYFETYSFQRTPIHDELRILNDLRRLNVVLSKEQRKRHDELIALTADEHTLTIFNEARELTPSAQLITTVHSNDENFGTLKNYLETEIEEEMFWMCLPIYRDAILFYNSKSELVEGINICLECDQIKSINNQRISTDFKTFKYLKQYLLKLGHKIEDPDNFKTDGLKEMINKRGG